MARKNRLEVNKRCLEIVNEYKITNQNDFAEIYNNKYNTSIKQPYVSYIFKLANIVYDKSLGIYVFNKKKDAAIRKQEQAEREHKYNMERLKNGLKVYSYGKVESENKMQLICIEVDYNHEKEIGALLLEYFGYNELSVVCGEGSVWVLSKNRKTTQALNAFLKENHK